MVRTFGAAGRRNPDVERVSSRRERRANLLKKHVFAFPFPVPGHICTSLRASVIVRHHPGRVLQKKKCWLLAVRAVRAVRAASRVQDLNRRSTRPPARGLGEAALSLS